MIRGCSLLGANLENAVLEIAVVDGAVVKEPEVCGRGFEVVNEPKRQRAEGKAADADRLAARLNAPDRSVDDKAAGGGASSDEGKHTFKTRRSAALARGSGVERFVERERCVGGEAKLGAVGKHDCDAAVGAGLDDIAAENKSARTSGRRATAQPGDAHLAISAKNFPQNRCAWKRQRRCRRDRTLRGG